MKMQPFFSVIIPVYNSEKYLNECIESVFAQTFQDFELVLVDDESKDSSSDICDMWFKKYPEKVNVIHQKNTGVYIAKRNGIKASVGKYLYVIDNDDAITSPKALEEIKAKIDNTGCDLIIFNATDEKESGHLLCQIPFSNGQLFQNETLADIYDHFLETKNFHHIWMMIFSRDLFDWDYEYQEPYRMLRDGASLVLPLLSNAKKVLYTSNVYYYWRVQNQSSASKHYDVVNFYYSIRHLHERILSFSGKWKYKTERTDDLIKKNYVADICIAAIKVRSISSKSDITRKDCLKMIANDKRFREEYTLKYLEGFRKPVAFALYHRMYWVVSVLSTVVGVVKGR